MFYPPPLSALLRAALLPLLLLAGAPALRAASAEDGAREMWMAGYLKYEEGAKAEKTNNIVLAIDLYRGAVTVFNQVQTKYPKWNQSLLDYRINFCKTRLQQLESSVAAKSIDLSKNELVGLARQQEARIKALTDELASAKKNLDLSSQALDRARAEAAATLAARTEMDRILQENKNLRETKAAAEQRAAALQADMEKLQSEAGIKEKAARLQQQLDVTLARQADLERDRQASLANLRALQDQVKATAAENDRLRTVQKTLAEGSVKLQKQAEALEDQAAELRQKLTDAAKASRKTGDELAAKTAQADELAANLKAAAATVTASQKTAAADQGKLHDLQTEARKWDKTRVSLESLVAERQAALDTARRDSERLEKDLADQRTRLKTLEAATANQNDAMRQAVAANARAEAALGDVRLLRKALDEAQDKNRSLETKLAAALRPPPVDVNAGKPVPPPPPPDLPKPEDALAARLARDQQLAALKRQVEDTAAEATRQNGMLDKIQLRNKELTDENRALKHAIASATGAGAPETENSAAVRARLEQALTDLRTRYDEGLQLARRQETRILDYEKTGQEQKDQLAAAAKGPKPADLEARDQELAGARKELAGIRDELAAERGKRQTDSAPVLDKMRQLVRELDQEKEKSQTLDQALQEARAKLQAATTAAITPTTPLPAAGSAATPGSVAVAMAGPAKTSQFERDQTVRSLLQQAAAAEQQGKAEAATWSYKKVLDLQTDNKFAIKRLGLLAANAGNQEETELWLRRAFYADPDDIDVLVPLGYSLVRQNKADLAVSMLSRAAALRPQDANVHRAYGVACSSLGWMDAAEAQFRRTLEINHADGEAAFNLAVLLASRNPPRTDDAREFYRKARELGVAADPGLDRLFDLK